jgi:hypothetical protein
MRDKWLWDAATFKMRLLQQHFENGCMEFKMGRAIMTRPIFYALTRSGMELD